MRFEAIRGLFLAILLMFYPMIAVGAPYAAMVMDAKTGKVIHSRNADTRLHPASLTKMMTLYVAFSAVKNGEFTMDSVVTISKHAASEPPSKLGLRAGSKIKMRYLVRAAAVKSANDAATAIGEYISGSEAKFAARMNRTAKELGMNRTTFKNAHGLTQSGHMSTARDMTILGKRLMYDFPEYYNLFSRQTTNAGLKSVNNTNRRLLSSFKGADGIKTGYTNAAGFNLVASAERGNKRIIATVFGGRTSASRNQRVAELLNMGFGKLPRNYAANDPAPERITAGAKPKVIKIARAPTKSPIPRRRPDYISGNTLIAGVDQNAVEAAILAANQVAAESLAKEFSSQQDQVIAAIIATAKPVSKPELEYTEAKVVEKSTSAPSSWGVQLGLYSTRFQAEKVLLKTVLADISSLDGALRKVVPSSVEGKSGFRAEFVGIDEGQAQRACARLIARAQECRAKPLGN